MSFGVEPAPVVIDASVAIELLAGDERWVEHFDEWARADRILLAPATFLPEVANGQLRGLRVPASDVVGRLERLLATGVEAVDRGLHGLIEAVDLADQHGLTVYDALYLQLALDIEGELATLDNDLAAAALAEGVALTP